MFNRFIRWFCFCQPPEYIETQWNPILSTINSSKIWSFKESNGFSMKIGKFVQWHCFIRPDLSVAEGEYYIRGLPTIANKSQPFKANSYTIFASDVICLGEDDTVIRITYNGTDDVISLSGSYVANA